MYYYVVEKKVDGVYLLDHEKQHLHFKTDQLKVAESMYNLRVNSKDLRNRATSKHAYILCSKEEDPSVRFLHVLKETIF